MTLTPADHYKIASDLTRIVEQRINDLKEKGEVIRLQPIEATVALAQVHATLATCRPENAS